MARAQSIPWPWLSCHLYYHQDLDWALRGFVHPVVVSLVQAGRIDAFFFVRYALGGPHVRLRLRVLPGFREIVLAEVERPLLRQDGSLFQRRKVERAAEGFLAATPSTESWEEEAIRRANESILASDPHETDDAVYPDNSFRVVPFRPEIERYGGPDLYRASLDFFVLSSVAALELLLQQENAPRAARLGAAFRLLLLQALGFAMDDAELADLLRYGVDSMGGAMPKILEKGDAVARAQRDRFLQLFRTSLTEARGGPSGTATGLLVAGSGGLSATIGFTDRAARAWIGGSHLHMTASRLGLGNVEEVYISRLLTATLAEVRAAGGESLLPGGAAMLPGRALSELLPPALAALETPGDDATSLP